MFKKSHLSIPSPKMLRDSSSATSLQPLDYLQTSPVRGQLEAYSDTTRTGWRFLQCTDTPNELKVLLPPRTALLYGQLLKAETSELAKLQHASWDRILEIRHLKDRMIRKCQRLVQSYSQATSSAIPPFLTLHAPSDFRMKEMEKWIRRQESHFSTTEISVKKKSSADKTKSRNSSCCNRCAMNAHVTPHHHVSSSRRVSMLSSSSHRSPVVERSSSKPPTARASPSTKAKVASKRSHSSSPARSTVIREAHEERSVVHENRTHYHSETLESRMYDSTHLQSRKTHDAKHRVVSDDTQNFHLELSPPRHAPQINHESEAITVGLLATSPEPLPHPYRGSTSTDFLPLGASLELSEDYDRVPALPIINSYTRANEEGPSSSPSPPSEKEDDAPGENGTAPPLRRRSSLKRSGSALRLSMNYSNKTVSWAMDRDWTDQMLKYEFATGEVDEIDLEWDSIFARYQEEMAGMKAMRNNVSRALGSLLAEAEKLQREDEVLRDQEDRLRLTFDQLENKHKQYRTKVKAALQETKQALTLCSAKRNDELQAS
ncbi:hypothetical protein SERLA73DRAFT_162583, partial [Serpula lacrymans var. lacrymans S7.3]